jgi:hypothetical protein
MITRHIPLSELADVAENRSAAAERERIGIHLAECEGCTAILRRLEHLFSMMRTDKEPDAPRDVIANAIAVFQSSAPQSSVLRRILAVLSFDSLNVAPAFGTRSGVGDSRQLLYTAEDNDIDLHISLKNDDWVIAGQVLGQKCRSGEVVIDGETITHRTKMNESCEFEFPVVPSGEYRLRLRLEDMEVEVPRLQLRK